MNFVIRIEKYIFHLVFNVELAKTKNVHVVDFIKRKFVILCTNLTL